MSFGSPVNRRSRQEKYGCDMENSRMIPNDPAWATAQDKTGESVAKGAHIAENTTGIREAAINRHPLELMIMYTLAWRGTSSMLLTWRDCVINMILILLRALEGRGDEQRNAGRASCLH